MDAKFARISPFQVDPEKIMDTFGISDEDFAPAAESEKESMVEKHKSVSYWRDAWRRFRANTVSMVALGVFVLCLLFGAFGALCAMILFRHKTRKISFLITVPVLAVIQVAAVVVFKVCLT